MERLKERIAELYTEIGSFEDEIESMIENIDNNKEAFGIDRLNLMQRPLQKFPLECLIKASVYKKSI